MDLFLSFRLFGLYRRTPRLHLALGHNRYVAPFLRLFVSLSAFPLLVFGRADVTSPQNVTLLSSGRLLADLFVHLCMLSSPGVDRFCLSYQ